MLKVGEIATNRSTSILQSHPNRSSLRGLYVLEPIHISQSTVGSREIFFVFYILLDNIRKPVATDFRNLFSVFSNKPAKMRF